MQFQLAGFRLIAGTYEPISPNEQGQLWSQPLALYLGVYGNRLRFFAAEGDLVPIPEEVAHQEHQQAEQAREQVNRLAAQLRE